MKILVFEYVTGGGFNRGRIPDTLAKEGLLMLKALLQDLSEITDIKLSVMLDIRFADSISEYAGAIEIVTIDEHQSVLETFEKQVVRCDAVWPVAPEINNILFELTRMIERLGKRLLSSSSEAVAITSNKLETFRHLTRHRIDTVPSEPFIADVFHPTARHVIKPVDGMSCERTFRVDDAEDWAIVKPQLGEEPYLLQPYIDGTPASLSCLFNHGKGWLLCHNVQRIEIKDCRFKLNACRVNEPGVNENHQALIDRVALALPGLSGYAGIDIIETTEYIAVLEINPRLTTSYAGIRKALGINVASEVLRMPQNQPSVNPIINRSINLLIDGDETYAN
ncbi:MAG: ATP-grasp domain-containing protein [Methylomicrobium sp.]|nr:ATP-grasp domain-containing protein [Methylomicrobium sp.]